MNSSIIASGDGPKYWIVGDQINFKVTGDASGGVFACAENYITPQHGPPPHVHHRDHECFYVLSGEFFFACGEKAYLAGAGAAVFLPRDVPHCFKNVGSTPGKFLLVAAPAGFETFVMEAGEAIGCIPFEKAVGAGDIAKLLKVCPKHQLEVLPDFKPATPVPIAKEDRKLWVLGLHVTIKLTSAQTQGTLSLVEVAARPGEGVPAHRHRVMDEIFYVLEGEWEFELDGQTAKVGPGGSVHVRPGVMHSFRNVGAGRGRLVDYHLPGGFEGFFEEAGVEARGEENAPEVAGLDRGRLLALFDRHGMDVGV